MPSPSPGPTRAMTSPITFPAESNSGPPELPKLTAASNWIRFGTERLWVSYSISAFRFNWLTMPVFNESARSKGLPMAATGSPIFIWLESAIASGAISGTPSSSKTATSLKTEEPTTLAVNTRPSEVMTYISSRASITWCAVRIWPSAS